MNFFKTVFSDEPQNEEAEDESGAGNPSIPDLDSPSVEAEESAASVGFGGWNLGSFIKTIATKSEQVIETYRRDLDEFRTGITQEARTVAANLPASFETGASVAQESLESVGLAIDVVFKSTADLISQALENPTSPAAPAGAKKFTRFELQLHAIQNDSNSYCEDPDDAKEFNKWRSGFSMEEKADEIEELCEENAVVGNFFTKLVPNSVDAESFWARYFFRVHKLKLVEEARAHLVKRVVSREEDEDLSWDVEDDDPVKPNESHESEVNEIKGVESDDAGLANRVLARETVEEISNEVVKIKRSDSPIPSAPESESVIEIEVPKGSSDTGVRENSQFIADGNNNSSVEAKEIPDEKTIVKSSTDSTELIKNGDVSVVSCQTSLQEDEEDLGWDEIEDLGSIDDKKTSAGGNSPNSSEIRKRLSAVPNDEDLSWDIEEDD